MPRGLIWWQDAGAALVARLLRPKPGERVLDLCAAPGGKTAQLAMSGATVTAVDRSDARLNRLRENLARLRLKAEIIVADGAKLEAEPFDAILIDAPCTATGTLRRHPETIWLRTLEDIAKLAKLQGRLIDSAVRLLKPGGRLVFCTCSLEREEGEAQRLAALQRHPTLLDDPVTPAEIGGNH